MSDLRIDLASLLEQRASERPGRRFLTLSGGARLTFGEFNAEVNRVAHGLTALLLPGDSVPCMLLARTPCERTATSLRLGKQAVRTADEASRGTDLAANIAAMLVCYARGSQQQAAARFTSKPQGSI
jgi:non-ribosomal peptide synthetase component F